MGSSSSKSKNGGSTKGGGSTYAEEACTVHVVPNDSMIVVEMSGTNGATPDFTAIYDPSSSSDNDQPLDSRGTPIETLYLRNSSSSSSSSGPEATCSALILPELRGIPPFIKSVVVDTTNLQHVQKMNNHFLAESEGIVSLHFTGPGFRILTQLGDYCITHGPNLRAVEFNHCFPAVTSIGNCFLSRSMITCVDVSGCFGLCNIIGDGFMEESAIEDVNFAGCFAQVVEIGSHFMAKCRHLKRANFTNCFAMTQNVGSKFLFGCTSLDTLMLPLGFPSATVIGSNFMMHCSSLRELKFNSSACFGQVSSLGDFFLASCTSLQRVDGLPGSFNRVEAVPKDFFGHCASLTAVCLANCFVLASTVESRFFSDCDALMLLDLRGSFNDDSDVEPATLDEVQERCFTHCPALQAVIVRPNQVDIFATEVAKTHCHPTTKEGIAPSSLSSTIVTCQPQPWRWSLHPVMSVRLRVAALAVHQGITYVDSRRERQFLPGEVAGIVCSYLPVDF